ncbi:MAG TPA: peptidase T [Candidatus Coatesbacteria bacterium]|nr:peptidase T [Candidatus Coatesbacteria bacterium]
MSDAEPAIIVHGGAWNIPDEAWPPHREGCLAAVRAGYAELARGASALDAVIAAVRFLEDDPTFDAGFGSVLGRDGYPEMDAGLMDGAGLRFGGVVGVRRFANPVLLARAVLEDGSHCLLSGEGAELFARERCFPECDPESLILDRERENWERYRREGFDLAEKFRRPRETAGAVALDSRGDLAAGNSTGGVSFKHPGRVGDSALPGCGLYADNRSGACCCSGWGEQIMRLVLAKGVVDDLGRGLTVGKAADAALARLGRFEGGRAGLILLTPAGETAAFHNTPRMAWASLGPRGEQAAE